MTPQPATLPLTPHGGLDLPVPARPASQLLAMGGDDRIDLDPQTGHNRYRCSTSVTSVAQFGSSTASSLSAPALAAVESLWERLSDPVGRPDAALLYRKEVERQRREFLQLCRLDDLPGLGVMFAASGTDLHLLTAQLAAALAPTPLHVVMVEESETGRGVRHALQGRHFSQRSPAGAAVTAGQAIGGLRAVEVHSFAARDAAGRPRSRTAIADEIDETVARLARNGRVLVTMPDLSKTGLAPVDLARLFRLRQSFPDAVEILVDACQFRLSTATLRGYLDRGCMVAVTGSKFLGGPPFCGALLTPAVLADRMAKLSLPPALGDYANAMDMPPAWRCREQLPERINIGLVLRWEAALEELRAFRATSDWKTARFLQRLSKTVLDRVSADEALELLETPRPDRQALACDGWDNLQTIFPLLVRRRGAIAGGAYFTPDETRQLYHQLEQDPENPVLLGQPVAAGERAGAPVAALRLCASARLIVEATCDDRAFEASVLRRVGGALDAVSRVARTFG